MLRSWALCALACSAAALSSTQHEHATSNNGRGLQEVDSPFGFSETPKCNRCGRDGPHDYNCCHPGGAWAGVCGDEGMVARGVAKYTYAQGFFVCQERLKSAFYRPRSQLRHTNRLVPALKRALGRQRLHVVILGDSVAVGEKDYDTFRAGQRMVRYGFGGLLLEWLTTALPSVNVTLSNAAVSATSLFFARTCKVSQMPSDPPPDVLIISSVRENEAVSTEALVRTLLQRWPAAAVVFNTWLSKAALCLKLLCRMNANSPGSAEIPTSRQAYVAKIAAHYGLSNIKFARHGNVGCGVRVTWYDQLPNDTVWKLRRLCAIGEPSAAWTEIVSNVEIVSDQKNASLYADEVHPTTSGHELIGCALKQLFSEGMGGRGVGTQSSDSTARLLPSPLYALAAASDLPARPSCAGPESLRPLENSALVDFHLAMYTRNGVVKHSWVGKGIGATIKFAVPSACGSLYLDTYKARGMGAGIVFLDGNYVRTVEADLTDDPNFAWLGPGRGLAITEFIGQLDPTRLHAITIVINGSATHTRRRPIRGPEATTFQVKGLICS